MTTQEQAAQNLGFQRIADSLGFINDQGESIIVYPTPMAREDDSHVVISLDSGVCVRLLPKYASAWMSEGLASTRTHRQMQIAIDLAQEYNRLQQAPPEKNEDSLQQRVAQVRERYSSDEIDQMAVAFGANPTKTHIPIQETGWETYGDIPNNTIYHNPKGSAWSFSNNGRLVRLTAINADYKTPLCFEFKLDQPITGRLGCVQISISLDRNLHTLFLLLNHCKNAWKNIENAPFQQDYAFGGPDDIFNYIDAAVSLQLIETKCHEGQERSRCTPQGKIVAQLLENHFHDQGR